MSMRAPICGRCGRVVIEAFRGTRISVEDNGGPVWVAPSAHGGDCLCDSCADLLAAFLAGPRQDAATPPRTAVLDVSRFQKR